MQLILERCSEANLRETLPNTTEKVTPSGNNFTSCFDTKKTRFKKKDFGEEKMQLILGRHSECYLERNFAQHDLKK